MVRTEAPEELILRRVAVGHSSVVQVSEVGGKKGLCLWAVCEKCLIILDFETLEFKENSLTPDSLLNTVRVSTL